MNATLEPEKVYEQALARLVHGMRYQAAYFFVVDRPLWLWNWSKPGKATNSALFAVILLVTGWMWLGLAIARWIAEEHGGWYDPEPHPRA